MTLTAFSGNTPVRVNLYITINVCVVEMCAADTTRQPGQAVRGQLHIERRSPAAGRWPWRTRRRHLRLPVWSVCRPRHWQLPATYWRHCQLTRRIRHHGQGQPPGQGQQRLYASILLSRLLRVCVASLHVFSTTFFIVVLSRRLQQFWPNLLNEILSQRRTLARVHS